MTNMFLSPLARQIVASIRNDPDRWHFSCIWLKRDDGLKVVVQVPFSGTPTAYVESEARGTIAFNWWEKRAILGSFRWWKTREIGE